MESPEQVASILQDMESQLNQVRTSFRELKDTLKPDLKGYQERIVIIEIDVVPPIAAFLADMTTNRNIWGRVVNHHGPGGGNPVLRFQGPYHELLTAVQQNWDGGIHSLADYIVSGLET